MTEIEVLRMPDGSIVIERPTVASCPSIRIQPAEKPALLTALLEDARKISDGDSYCCSLCHVATTNDLRPICTPCFDRITY